MSTARAILRGIGGVHRDALPTGPCCLVGEQTDELSPCRIADTLGETVGMHHPVDTQVFDTNHLKGIDDPPAVLLRKIAASPGGPFIDPCHHLAAFGACWRALLLFGKTAVRFGKRLLLRLKEAGIGDQLVNR